MTNTNSPLKLELLKSLITALVGAFIFFLTQQWTDNDLEFRNVSREAYLSSLIGEQGLSLKHESKELKNISIVEFGIFNRTSRNFNDVNLIFTPEKSNEKPKLISSTLIPPNGLPLKDTIDELPTKEPNSKGFSIKVIPKQKDNEYFHAVFIFEGEKAPKMTVTSTTSAAAIVPYREWKDNIKVLILTVATFTLAILISFLIASLLEHIFAEKNHRKLIEKFKSYISNLQETGKIKPLDNNQIAATVEIYKLYTKPKINIIWKRLLNKHQPIKTSDIA